MVASVATMADDTRIRPFRIDIPQDDLDDLRDRAFFRRFRHS